MTQEQITILRAIPIEDLASRLGLDVRHHKALCPFHNDHHASLSFNVRKNGDTIDLVRHLLNKDFQQACLYLSDGSIEPIPAHTPHSPHSPHETQSPFDPSRYEKYFDRPYLSPEARRFLFDQRRLDPRVIRWCRLTSWRDRNGIHWLQIPYFDPDGNLIGIQNRNLTPGAEPFPKGARCSIYNLPILNLLKENEPLYIAEGASDCWALLSAGHKAIAIPSATLLKKDDLQPLITLNSTLLTEFHMYPDRDLPGERLFLQLQALLPNLTHHHLPPSCKDYSDLYRCAKREQSKLACYAGSCGS